MKTDSDTPKDPAGAGSSPAAGSSVWNPLDDEFEEILGGSWAVIRTADGWEIECQHSQTTLPLKSTDMESAKIKGRKLARQFENRYQTNKSDAGNGSEVICRVFIAYSSPLPRPPCYAPRIIMDIAKSIIVVGLAAVSAWLHIKDKDGSGWALLALLVLIFA